MGLTWSPLCLGLTYVYTVLWFIGTGLYFGQLHV